MVSDNRGFSQPSYVKGALVRPFFVATRQTLISVSPCLRHCRQALPWVIESRDQGFAIAKAAFRRPGRVEHPSECGQADGTTLPIRVRTRGAETGRHKLGGGSEKGPTPAARSRMANIGSTLPPTKGWFRGADAGGQARGRAATIWKS